jgi:UDP-2-acetamido-2-deoxy-ribo-hexuluronate aminotransferase
MAIPYLDLKPHYKRIQAQVEPKILQVLAGAQYILGPEVAQCEKELAAFAGTQSCLTIANGTIALQVALQAIDIQPGDEVITTSFSFFATAEVISTLGAKPVFVDIDEKTFNIDASQIEAKITPRTKAIMPVSLYGQIADMDEINAIAAKHKLYVIEDAAQSFGATYKNKRSCSVSHIGSTSFFPAKPLGVAGDGGAVFTNDPELAKKLEYIRNHGQTRRYYHEFIGTNARLDTLQCVILSEKLKYYSDDIRKRQAIANTYNEAFSGLKNVIIPTIKSDRESVWAQYTLRVENRDQFAKDLEKEGVPTSVHYPFGIHEQPIYKKLLGNISLPVTEKMSKSVISLPLYPDMPQDHVNIVIEAVRKVSR